MSTDAAATSFAILASFLISGLTMSTIASIAVFMSSSIMTHAIVMVRIAHSIGLNLSTTARIEAIMPIITWILKFLPLVMPTANPSSANLKLFKSECFDSSAIYMLRLSLDGEA